MKNFLLIIFFAAFASSCGKKKTAKDDSVFYTCSMDPQVVSDKPGKCPVCGMPLTVVKKSTVEHSDDLELSDQQVQLGNILVDTISKKKIASQIELTGTVKINASQLTTISARVMGRIEKLYIKTTGDFVAKGAPLYELYSEELNNAKQEYIAALQRKSLFAEQALIDFETLISSARTKLKLWGMTENQINALEKSKVAPVTTTFYSTQSGFVTSLIITEGGYVMEGSAIATLANLSSLWVEAEVYTTQLYQIPKWARATLLIPGIEKRLHGRIEFANPVVATDRRINILRVVVPNYGNQLKPGMSAVINVQTSDRTSLTMPTDAVIQEANAAIVWVQTGKNRFRSQMVTTGLESDGLTEILSGLKEGDVVVVQGSYLLHSEFVFKRGANPMAGHVH